MQRCEIRRIGMVVYQCEDSLEGIFTAIYNAYEDRNKPEDTCINLTQELMLFAEYVPVIADDGKAQKVINTLLRKFGSEDYHRLCLALSTPNPDKSQAVYRTVADGLSRQCRPGHLFDNLAHNYVHQAFSLARGALVEYDHLRGFLRFEELKKGILYSEMDPKNHLLPFLMEHFVDRFPMENFMVYDQGRHLMGIHPANNSKASCTDLQAIHMPEWFMLQCDNDPREEFSLVWSEREVEYQELFRHFCHKITVRERINPALQRNMLPLRFREYMTEFQT